MKTPLATLAAALLFCAAGPNLCAVESTTPKIPASQKQAQTLKLPKVNFQDATVREAADFLGQRSKMLDPQGKGVNIIYHKRSLDGGAREDRTMITLSLNDVPLEQVLLYVANLANARLRWDPHAIIVQANIEGKVPPEEKRPEVTIAAGVDDNLLVNPLLQTTIPKIAMEEATPVEALEFLKQRCKALLPGGKEVNIVIKAANKDDLPKITFNASDLPLMDAFRYVAEFGGLEMEIEPMAIVFTAQKK